MSNFLSINTIKPTVFFLNKKNELLQVVDISIKNTEEDVEAIVEIKFGSRKIHTNIGKVKQGQQTYQIYIPDSRKSVSVEFILKAHSKVQDQQKMFWKPKRHWQVYMIPITHHDFGYTEAIENVLYQYDDYYDKILRFCEETEGFPFESKYRYTVEGAWSINHFIENRLEKVVKKLVKYMKEERIEASAFLGNEITNLCGHEELIRLAYPSFQLKQRYGIPIRTACIVDIPGLSWGIPTVLAGAGVKYFFAGLPTYFEWGRSDIHTFWDESRILRHGRPDAFRWMGPDGSSVLVYYQGSYGFLAGVTGPHSYKEVMDNLPNMLDEMERQGSSLDIVRYIHNGLDNYPPDVEISYIAREWNNKWAYPKLIVATNSMFFEHLEKQCSQVRVFKGELPDTDYVVGAISTARETSINRITHDRLHSAEKFATIASVASDYSYPAERIRKAYDNLLLYDEHTWGMSHPVGKLQDWNWSDKSHCAYKASGLTQSILSRSLDGITNKIGLKEEDRHIIVFNSLSFQRTDVTNIPKILIEEPGAHVVAAAQCANVFDLVDEETGQKIPYQIIKLDSPQAPVPYAAHRYARGQFNSPELFDLVFMAENVPSLGYKTYRVVPKEKATSFRSSIVVGERSLENRFFKVILNPQTGAIESIYDKEFSREIVDKDAPHKVNQFIARWVKSGKEEGLKKAKIQKRQSGPIYGSLIVSGKGAGCPELTQEIILYDKIKRIDIRNRLLKDSTPLLEIYFAFPFLIKNPRFQFEGSNSVIEPLKDQFPGSNSDYYAVQHWVDIFNEEAGITFSPIEAHLVELGGLWPSYVSQAHHGVTPHGFEHEFKKPGEFTKGYIYSYVMNTNFRTNFQTVQQSDMLFCYSITTHQGDWKKGRPRDFGWAIGNPLISVCVNGKKKGTLQSSTSFCQLNKPNVLLLTLKEAEDRKGLIIRLIETEGKDTTVNITLPLVKIKKAYLANLVEENQKRISAQKHIIRIIIKSFTITTIRIQYD